MFHTKIFNLLAVLSLALLLSACGDDDNKTKKVVTTSTSPITAPTGYNPTNEYQTVADFNTFRTKVAAGNFKIPNSYSQFRFDEYSQDIQTSDYNCGWNFDLFRWESETQTCQYSQYRTVLDGEFLRSETGGNLIYENGLVSFQSGISHTAIISSLLQLIEESRYGNNLYRQTHLGESRYKISTDNGISAIIDLNIPLIANPVEFINHNDGYSYFMR